ncbi:hypothetical protein ACFFHM_02480 [Halalkalibacter kiskunsagensis]|uniref:Uncharacterized protein n=1 Tax=Halalkalibacter kiskunsagensis TaxID=1548599 RepID=A0ABV6K913_9BACI
MELLDWLCENYQWQNVKFVNEALVETEQGRKRLRYWSDKALLDWHIEWRDRCNVTPYVLADRMIRNKDQEAAISWKGGWLTVHDEVDQGAVVSQSEKEIGRLIGAMIHYGVQSTADIEPVQQKEPMYSKLHSHVPYLRESHRQFVSALLKESEIRMKKATALQASLNERLPLLDPVTTPKQAKMVYDVLIWFGTRQLPERGYYSLRMFLSEWLEKYGKESLESLIEGMYEKDRVTREQAIFLCSECLCPYELDNLVMILERNPTEAEIEEEILNIKKEWEQSKILVQVISSSIDKKKKVFTQ